jgi:ATP-binding cassette, subfamily B, bacterial PglK
MIADMHKSVLGLFRLLAIKQKRGGFVCLSVMLSLAFMEIVAASLIMSMAATIMSPGQKTGLVSMALVCVTVFAVKGALALLDCYVQNEWIQTIILDFKRRLVERYTRMDYAHQIMRNSGQSLSVLYNDADLYLRIGLTSLGIMLTEACVFVIMIGFLVYMQPLATAMLIGAFAVIAALFVIFLAPLFRRWSQIVQETARKGYQEAMQILQSYKDILIFGKADYFIARYMHQSQLRARITVKSNMAQIIPRISIETLFMLFFALIVVIYSRPGHNIDALTPMLGAYLYAGFRLLPGLNRIIIQLSNVKMSEPSFQRIGEDLSAPAHENVYVSAPGLTFRQDIALRNVSYRYPGTDRNILADTSLEIRRGEFVGIVGETGSGKSTLLHLLLGLIIPTSGTVLVDGRYPVNSIEWHEKIGYAAQNFHLIDGSIADNIAFGTLPETRDSLLIEAAVKGAQLERFITQLPQGIDTPIGEKGVLISGGERQRIALARALYRRPEVLMLDEATSALDLDTEASLMQAIEHLKGEGLTIIAVTHRLETLKAADRILIIEGGRIAREIAGGENIAETRKKRVNDNA